MTKNETCREKISTSTLHVFVLLSCSYCERRVSSKSIPVGVPKGYFSFFIFAIFPQKKRTISHFRRLPLRPPESILEGHSEMSTNIYCKHIFHIAKISIMNSYRINVVKRPLFTFHQRLNLYFLIYIYFWQFTWRLPVTSIRRLTSSCDSMRYFRSTGVCGFLARRRSSACLVITSITRSRPERDGENAGRGGRMGQRNISYPKEVCCC